MREGGAPRLDIQGTNALVRHAITFIAVTDDTIRKFHVTSDTTLADAVASSPAAKAN
jgi:hypothetical protein